MKSKLFLGLLILVALTACGKKPSFVDAPVGKETAFPRLYPLNGELPPGTEPGDIEEEAAEEEVAPASKPAARPVAPTPVIAPPAAKPAISDEELNQFQ